MKQFMHALIFIVLISGLNTAKGQNYDVGMVDISNFNHPHGHNLARGVKAIADITIENLGAEIIPANTIIPFSLELGGNIQNTNFTLSADLQPGESVKVNLNNQDIPYIQIIIGAQTPDNLTICGWTSLNGDIDNTNDSVCTVFNVYTGNRDIGVSAIIEPTENQTLNRQDTIDLTFTINNFGDTDLVYLQEIVFSVNINGGSEGIGEFIINDLNGFSSGSSFNLTIENYIVPANSDIGANEICIATLWSIDNNTANDESCVSVNIDYATSIEKLTEGSIEAMVYPNPANNVAYFTYHLSQNENVSIQIYDIHGRLIENLLDEVQIPGQYNIKLDTEKFKNGLYLYSIQSGEDRISGTLMIER